MLDFKEQLKLYLEDGMSALPSIEILLTKNRLKILALLDAVDEVEALDRNITGPGMNFGEQMDKWVSAHQVLYRVRSELKG